tara:strand:- start:493 stop:624 length:132 start_codon:yes stop_codon:yes gene_type:complete
VPTNKFSSQRQKEKPEFSTGAFHIAICADNKIAIEKAKREAGI